MLQLRDIKKSYAIGDTVTTALKGVSVSFRKSEFVAILGPSGCGKTTLLNVIGGLDQYDSGDLIINGRSTKEYKDSDWDSYRNHSIGFVFQSYNLIPHQTVLANVELALTLSGVSKSERKARALEALGKVGIADQAKKKPNQLSGGQMQRVAIARALVNNPDILLADEPTGALDTATSVQIMELLKEISKEKLVIMVTHNPELANDYATRIVNLKDGEIISDANPVIIEEIPEEKPKKEKKKGRKTAKTSMSFFTALSLSLNNLMTKKTRTVLTSFAGSIGIIGIALILSLSSGFKAYINKVQEDTLSTYPIQITSETLDMTSVLTELTGASGEYNHELDKVYARPIFGKLINTMMSEIQSNDLKAFKNHIEDNKETLDQYITDIKYTYGVNLDVYSKDTSKGVIKVNPMEVFNAMMGGTDSSAMMMGGMSSSNVWNELLDNRELLDSQYDIVDGKWPEAYNEVVLFVDENNEINDYILCGLGLIDQGSVYQMMSDIQNGKPVAEEMTSYSYEEILGLEFSLVPASAHYVKNEETGIWENKSKDELHMKNNINKGVDIKIVGIMRPKESATATSATSMIGYTHALTEHCITLNNDSPIVKQQLSEEIDTLTSKKYGAEYKFCEVDIFTGIPFGYTPETKDITIEDVHAYIATLPAEQQQMLAQQMGQMTDEQIIEIFSKELNKNTETTMATLKTNLIKLGAAELDTPNTINIYAKDFESKDSIASFIDDYNKAAEDGGEEEKVIRYTDLIGIMMSSISTIIDVISYVLIAFVSISLVVSSIMIGIITYISVLERTKEIGILRAIGASKKDITRVFNAETIIVGFVAGALGILTTILLNFPINAVIYAFGDIQNVSKLPIWGAIALVVISMVLTWFAGLIPSRVASKKDPVVALRTE
ncbi:MAG: ABC transporter ATP-binding protein/permease [Ruminococcaceae bacterium]|nr:ABC transporter ATP-binding protein/permease [Oscillospiraceae bacterium]